MTNANFMPLGQRGRAALLIDGAVVEMAVDLIGHFQEHVQN
jgi:hypothetical protein